MEKLNGTYSRDLADRYWAYCQARNLDQRLLDRPYDVAKPLRPPVFRREFSEQNVILQPDASQSERARLLSMIPPGEHHKWFRSMNSSQALTLSILGNLAIHDRLSLLADLEDDHGLPLFAPAEMSPARFSLEHKVRHLGEPRSTSLDGILAGEHPVSIECKFTEAEFGSCSRPGLRPSANNHERDHCDGSYTQQRRRATRCSLTEVGVRYWNYIPRLFSWSAEQDHRPCPLAANYQLVRNLLSVAVDDGSRIRPGHVVVFYDARNPAFQSGGRAAQAFDMTRAALHEPERLRKASWQRLLAALREQSVLPWLTAELAAKYGL